MERDVRFALFHQNQQFQIAVRDCQLRARDAVNPALFEPSQIQFETLDSQIAKGIVKIVMAELEETQEKN